MAKRHMERCSALLITGEMKIKVSKRKCLKLVREDIIKMSKNSKCWRGQEKGCFISMYDKIHYNKKKKESCQKK